MDNPRHFRKIDKPIEINANCLSMICVIYKVNKVSKIIRRFHKKNLSPIFVFLRSNTSSLLENEIVFVLFNHGATRRLMSSTCVSNNSFDMCYGLRAFSSFSLSSEAHTWRSINNSFVNKMFKNWIIGVTINPINDISFTSSYNGFRLNS